MGMFDDIPIAQVRAPFAPRTGLPRSGPGTPPLPAVPVRPLPSSPSVPAMPVDLAPPDFGAVPQIDVTPPVYLGAITQDVGPQMLPPYERNLLSAMTVFPDAFERGRLGTDRFGGWTPQNAAPDPDQSTALGDLMAGWLGLQQVPPALSMVSGIHDMASGEWMGAAAQAFGQEDAAIRARLDEIGAVLAGPRMPSDQRRALEAEMVDLQGRLNQIGLAAGEGGIPALAEEGGRELSSGIATISDAAPRLEDLQAQIDAIPMNPAAQAIGNAATLGDAFAAYFSDPLGATRTFGLRALPQSAPSIAAGGVGQLLGGPLGAAGAAGAAGAQIERGSTLAQGIVQMMRQDGIDTSDRAAVDAWVQQNRAALSDILGSANMRAAAIGAVDALTGGLTGGIARATQGLSTAPRMATAAASGTLIDPAGEAAGEALAQLATTGQVRPGDVLAEALGGLAAGAPGAITQTLAERVHNDVPQPQEGNPLPAPPPPAVADRSPVPAPTVQEGRPGGEVGPALPPDGGAVSAADPSPGSTANLTAQPEAPRFQPTGDTARAATVYTPENDPVQVEYQVVEADDLVTSFDEGFDQSAQPRSREGNANSEMQIERIANNPIFDRLYRAPETDRGAPLIGQDGLVESGNGRVTAPRRAYDRGTASQYRAALEAQFPEAAGMNRPVVVALRTSQADRTDLAYRSNQPATMAMSAVESARAEARLVDHSILSRYRGGDLTSAANRDMVRNLIQRLPQTEQNALLTPQGGLTTEGVRRVQATFFARAYDDPDLLTRMAASPDDDMKGITSVLTDAAPRVAQMIEAIERGAIAADGNFIPHLTEAIRQVSNLRSRGMTLADQRAQTDAFADPVPAVVDDIMSALYNETGTRLASKAAVSDFLSRAVELASAQETTTADMPGVEPAPVRNAEEIVRAARQAPDDSPTFLETASDPRAGGEGGGGEARRSGDGSGREADAGAGRVGGGRPTGKLSPRFLNFSFNNYPSVFQSALRDAGIDPEAARLMDVDQQIAKIAPMIEAKFGVTVELPKVTVQKKNIAGRKVAKERTSLNSRMALDQLLDAYQNLQMLAAVMAVPEKAIGLPIDGQGIILSLVGVGRLRGALGMFSYGKDGRKITLPGRSNSFAHEWGHALDHFLNTMHGTGEMKHQMLTRNMDAFGVTAPQTPAGELTTAFAQVMTAMFGDSSNMGAFLLDLQVKAAQVGDDQKPTPAAIHAQNVLDGIAAGKRPPMHMLSKYFKTSEAYDQAYNDGGGYFTDPAEMFARAVEAWVGRTVGQTTDLPQSFLTKGNWAYDSNDDARLEMTFPKGADADQFAAAMGNLSHALMKLAVFGPDAPANVPVDTPAAATHALFRVESNRSFLSDAARAEKDQMRIALGRLRALITKEPYQRVREGISSATDAFLNTYVRSMGQAMSVMIQRQTKPAAREALQNVASKVAHLKPGSGEFTGNVYQERLEQMAKQWVNKVMGALKKHYSTAEMPASAYAAVRALLVGDASVKAQPKDLAIAADLRSVLNEIWYALQNQNVPVGYVKDYLPSIYSHDLIDRDRPGFIAKAEEVYALMFEREIVENPDPETQTSDMWSIIRGLRRATKATPTGDRVRAPHLTGSDEALVTAWQKARQKLSRLQREQAKSDDPDQFEAKIAAAADEVETATGDLLDVLKREYAAYSADAWMIAMTVGQLNDYGGVGPTANFLKSRVFPPEASKILADFMPPDPVDIITGYAFAAARRIAWAEAFGDDNSRLDNMLQAAADAGVSEDDIAFMKVAVHYAAGRVSSDMRQWQRWVGNVVGIYQTGLLTFSAFASLAEPGALGVRTGSVRDGLKGYLQYIRVLRKNDRQGMQELARAIGLIVPSTMESVMQNRLSLEMSANNNFLQRHVARFFRLNLLTPLTSVQRAMILPVVNHAIIRLLRDDVRGERTLNSRARDAVAGGVGRFASDELNELGIAKHDRASLLDWLETFPDKMPATPDLFQPDGQMHEAALVWQRAVARMVDQSIQNPLKTDRPLAANNPTLAPIFGITSFMSAVTRNLIFRTLERGVRKDDPLRIKGGKMAANAALAVAPFAALYVGQFMATALREFMLNGEKWEERDDDDELLDYLLTRAFQNTGIAGRLDPIQQAITGIKYETDLTNMVTGPAFSHPLGLMQDMFSAAFGRNSAATDTAERKAASAAYRLIIQPAAAIIATSFGPAGPVSSLLSQSLLFGSAAKPAAEGFADAVVGPAAKP